MIPFAAFLDYASVLVFALTGALVASRAQLDIVGFAFFACLTGVGGGTLRDLLLDRHPVFWIADPTYLAVGVGAAIFVFFAAPRLESRWWALQWLDAAALAIAAAAGSAIAQGLDQPAPVVVVMGMVTGCIGGLTRDVVANEVPMVLRQGELYVTCAFAGSLATVLAGALGASEAVAALACVIVTFALRAGSLARGWALPLYRAQPPKRR